MTDRKDESVSSNLFIENELKTRLNSLCQVFDADVISCFFPILQPFDDLLRNSVEDIPNKKPSCLVILETTGGSIETAERMADLLRQHYSGEVSFLIPNFAMSAGTVLIMSGDKIHMDYYSVIGPIDPQVEVKAGDDHYVPALGYLAKFAEFVKKSNKGTLSPAETVFMVEKFDPAELDQFEKARDLSVDLLKQWLVRYKFKNWTKTATRGIPVTPKMRSDRAAEIARKLNDTKRWKTHGRGISAEVARRELNLIIEDFGADQRQKDTVRGYYRLLQDYMLRRDHNFIIHTPEQFVAL